MKLSVSNIAWKDCNFYNYAKLIKNNGCGGIEIAPSCIWKEPTDVSKKEILSLQENLKKNWPGNSWLTFIAIYKARFTIIQRQR